MVLNEMTLTDGTFAICPVSVSEFVCVLNVFESVEVLLIP